MNAMSDSTISQMIRRKRFFDSSNYWMNTKRKNRMFFWQNILKPFLVTFGIPAILWLIFFLLCLVKGDAITWELSFHTLRAISSSFLFFLPLFIMIEWKEAFSKLHSGRWIVTRGGIIFRESKDQRTFLPWSHIHRIDVIHNRLIFDARHEQLVMKIRKNDAKNSQLIWFLNSLITFMQKRNIQTDSVVSLRNTLICMSIPVMRQAVPIAFMWILTILLFGLGISFRTWFVELLCSITDLAIMRELLVNAGIALGSGFVILLLAYWVVSRELVAAIRKKHYRELVESFRSLSPKAFRYTRNPNELPAELTSDTIQEILQRQYERRKELVKQFNTLPRRFDWTCYFHLMTATRLLSFVSLLVLGGIILGDCGIYFQWSPRPLHPVQWHGLVFIVAGMTGFSFFVGLMEWKMYHKLLVQGKVIGVPGGSVGLARHPESRFRNKPFPIQMPTVSESGESQWITSSFSGKINGPRNRIRDNGCIIFVETEKADSVKKSQSKYSQIPLALVYYDQSEVMVYKQGKWTITGYERLELLFHLIAWISCLVILFILNSCI